MINGLIFKGVNEKILPTLKSIDVDYTECTGLSCGKFYNIGTLPSGCSQLDFSFKQIEDYEIPIGFLQFNIDENSSLTSLSGTYDNEDVKWLNKPSTFVEGKTYQIHFLNSCCTCEEYDEDGQSISTDSYLNRAESLSCTTTDTSFALGGACKASNDYSVAEGYDSNARGEASHAEGYYTTAVGTASHSEGGSTNAVGGWSHAEGAGTCALSSYSHAEGYDSIANGYAAHAEGHTTKATSAMAHAEGSLTNAKAYASHAEGELAEVNSAADYSHAEGKTTYCIGRAAHAEGGYTIVNNDYEHAEGRFNYSHSAAPGFGSSANTIHSIGIGSGIFADGISYDLLSHGELPAGAVTAHSKNAVEVMQNGDIYMYGAGGYDGNNLSGKTIQYMLENPTSKYIIIDSSDYTDNVDVELRLHEFTDFGTLPTACTGLTVKYITTIGNTLSDGSFQFTLPEGTTFETLSVIFPSDTTECKYANMPETFEAGKTYQITMVNGCCAIGVFE